MWSLFPFEQENSGRYQGHGVRCLDFHAVVVQGKILIHVLFNVTLFRCIIFYCVFCALYIRKVSKKNMQ